MTPILILGAGPAGAAVALGLRRLGYTVTLISEWRRFAALEGVSQRVLEALRGAGLNHALADATLPSQRQVSWNGQRHAQNIEFLLDRPAFDRGVREDLRLAGVDLAALVALVALALAWCLLPALDSWLAMARVGRRLARISVARVRVIAVHGADCQGWRPLCRRLQRLVCKRKPACRAVDGPLG